MEKHRRWGWDGVDKREHRWAPGIDKQQQQQQQQIGGGCGEVMAAQIDGAENEVCEKGIFQILIYIYVIILAEQTWSCKGVERAELPEISLVLFVVKCELGQVLTGAEITADLLGGFQARRRKLGAVDQSWTRGVGVPKWIIWMGRHFLAVSIC